MPKLAINGGPAEALELERKIPNWPRFDERDGRSLIEVLESRKWCRIYPGSKGELLERAFSEYHDAKYGIAVSNGTVALELALKSIGVGFGDEVIVPAVTFIATASAVTEVGAIPIFADIDPETATIDPESLESSITKRTKAAIAVHYGGYPADFDRILPILKKHGLFLIEDCAHAHGTEWKGRKVGAIGDMGAFSFQESKSLPAGEGGMVLTNSEQLAEKARLIHNIGRVVGKPGYEHHLLSSNYRMSEFQAALLLSRMKSLEQETETKHANGEYLAREFKEIRGVEPLRKDSRVTKRGYYFFIIRYDPKEFDDLPKDRFLQALNAEGVPSSNGYGMPLYKQPAFRKQELKGTILESFQAPDYENLYLPNSEGFIAKQITMPHPLLLAEPDALDLVISSVRKIKDNTDELLNP